jgi:hypothetical protein
VLLSELGSDFLEHAERADRDRPTAVVCQMRMISIPFSVLGVRALSLSSELIDAPVVVGASWEEIG